MSSMKTKVVVVIPNWNGEDFIKESLLSLEKQSFPHDVIVVDNGSSDNSVSIIEKAFPKVKLLKFKDNAGFAGGVNRGIKPALKEGHDYIVLFNNDAVADKRWLEHLVSAAKLHNESGIITGKFMRMDKKHIDSTGDQYSIWGMPFPSNRNILDNDDVSEGKHVFSATGGASLYRTSMLKEIGLFDEKFFAYYEDVDISFRAQLAGWKVWYEPKALAYHHVSGTSSKLGDFSRYHATKNFFMLYVKNMPSRLFVKYLPLFFIQSVRLFLSSLLQGSGLVFIKGKLKSLSYAREVLKDRRTIQKSRKVTSQYIDSLLYKHRPPKIPSI
jgi:GT2 family glycosyltransferase